MTSSSLYHKLSSAKKEVEDLQSNRTVPPISLKLLGHCWLGWDSYQLSKKKTNYVTAERDFPRTKRSILRTRKPTFTKRHVSNNEGSRTFSLMKNLIKIASLYCDGAIIPHRLFVSQAFV
eukprot:m.283068 g.283068  ORF g.283068 m.283068 type:complete len:120 (+) comp40669_c0_seq2:1751-2110(+)